jgi:hypothetical protein
MLPDHMQDHIDTVVVWNSVAMDINRHSRNNLVLIQLIVDTIVAGRCYEIWKIVQW